jgi:type VI secretion system protein ImpL
MPLEASSDVGQVTIGLDGQNLSYTVGQAARVGSFQWTGASGQARIEFTSPNTSAPTQYTETGPWAWFKLLDQAQLQPLGTGQFRVTFQASGRQASYELRLANGGNNPFRLRELENFRCPEQL